MSPTPFPVFIGWDSREDVAYQVCRFSMERRCSHPLAITPLKQGDLRRQGLYRRPEDPLASTEFTYTRFLVPHLVGYTGWALFCDCDFLWLADIAGLLTLTDDRYAVMCVHHDYRPTETVKMDGKVQTVYPRKNWSSLMLLNCGHPSTRRLTPAVVNDESPAYLHRFAWAADAEIGPVPLGWNWLEGWNDKPANGTPEAVHFTRGGPWFEQWQSVDYGALWLAEAQALTNGLQNGH